MYDPTVGRFISEDPDDFTGGDTDLARYVKNEPTDLTDPTGERPKEVDELLPPPDGSILTGTIFDPNSPAGGSLINGICTPPAQLGALSKREREKMLNELENERIPPDQDALDRLERTRQLMEKLHYNMILEKADCLFDDILDGVDATFKGGLNPKKGGIDADWDIDVNKKFFR